MDLRIAAVAAPEFQSGASGDLRLNSSDPASLYNACRWLAKLSEQSGTCFADSNWAEGRAARRHSTRLYHTLRESEEDFTRLLVTYRPTLLLIGAMTLCLPGAISLARLARHILGDQVCIVLGGKHCNETVYLRGGGVRHHASSPLILMKSGLIPEAFDLVISGEGEHIVAKIAELVATSPNPASVCQRLLNSTEVSNVEGNWIIGRCQKSELQVLHQKTPMNMDRLPAQCAMFGVTSHFDVFPPGRTAHVHSDTGPGCVYSCGFCSESSKLNGSLQATQTSAARLARQLAAAASVIRSDNPCAMPSAFVEDSILLGGVETLLHDLVAQLAEASSAIPFGGQLTIDHILRHRSLLTSLREVGLSYIFFGLESIDPSIVSSFSKNRQRTQPWEERAESALRTLAESSIGCGVALLFGLGESPSSRSYLFETLSKWRRQYGIPSVISANWAVQHPLQSHDGGANHTYLEWGTDEGPLLELLQNFGEAAERYPILGQSRVRFEDALEVSQWMGEFRQIRAP